MAQSFLIHSIHKKAINALRHASQLRREFTADVDTYQFTEGGRRSKRGTHYTFKVTPQRKEMWRIIVGYPYLLNQKKQKSPDARTMKATYYAKTKAEVIAEKATLRKAALHEIKKLSKAWIQEKRSHPLYRRVNVQVARVEYEAQLIGTTTYLDD